MTGYDVNAFNTNRIVRFRVEVANVADVNASMFCVWKGRNNSYPSYGAITTALTNNQELAVLRTSLVARALTRYAILVGVRVAADSRGTALPANSNFGPALELSFETDERGEFYNNAWAPAALNTVDKHLPGAASDGTPGTYSDTVGVGGMSVIKTKPDLNGLLAAIASISYDNGTTGPFGTKSTTGNITLPSGAVTSAAPVLSTGVGLNASGLRVQAIA